MLTIAGGVLLGLLAFRLILMWLARPTAEEELLERLRHK